MIEIVRNPQTGNPAVAETVYRDLERDVEQASINQLENELVTVTEQYDAASNRKAALESQLADKKSIVEGIDRLTQPEGNLDDGSVGDGSEDENQEQVETVLL